MTPGERALVAECMRLVCRWCDEEQPADESPSGRGWWHGSIFCAAYRIRVAYPDVQPTEWPTPTFPELTGREGERDE